MKKGITHTLIIILLIAAGNIIPQTLHAQADEVLTNQSIVDLYKLGLGEEFVLTKIKTTKNNFDVTIPALVQLHKDSIPSTIINAMMVNASKNKAAIQQDPNDPYADHATGIYHYKGQNELIQILPTNSTAAKTNAIAHVLSQGFASANEKTMLAGVNARYKMNESSPVFLFYIPETNQNSEGTFNNSNSVSSPNDFLLIQFSINEKQNSREIKTGSYSNTGSQSGVDNAKSTAFNFKKIKSGIYVVKLDQPLDRGEYGFKFTDNSVRKVYDFSVQ